ncbi:unnamed protein product [Prunus armeniaca]
MLQDGEYVGEGTGKGTGTKPKGLLLPRSDSEADCDIRVGQAEGMVKMCPPCTGQE